jgi:hypothetical protein
MSGAFRCWLPSDARPETPNVTALNSAFAAERFVERDLKVVQDGEEVLVEVEGCGRSDTFRVAVEVDVRYVVRAVESAQGLALEELHSDALAEGTSS